MLFLKGVYLVEENSIELTHLKIFIGRDSTKAQTMELYSMNRIILLCIRIISAGFPS